MAGLCREEVVVGSEADLGAFLLTNLHSDAPLMLMPLEGVGTLGRMSCPE